MHSQRGDIAVIYLVADRLHQLGSIPIGIDQISAAIRCTGRKEARKAYTDYPGVVQQFLAVCIQIFTQPPGLLHHHHVVAVKTGVELTFDDGAWANPYALLDYAAEGIYLFTTFGAYIGLWLMDPATGAITGVANLSNAYVYSPHSNNRVIPVRLACQAVASR